MKAHDLCPSIGIKYDASGLTLFMYSSSFVRKLGSCINLFPGSAGILVLIRNLIYVDILQPYLRVDISLQRFYRLVNNSLSHPPLSIQQWDKLILAVI
jgi:hypothetical protein